MIKVTVWLVSLSSFLLFFSCDNPGWERGKEIDPVITRAIATVDERNLRQTIAHLQTYGNRVTREKQWQAVHWLIGRFKELGIDARIHTYENNGKTWPNVIASIKGKEQPEEIIMPIAHIDSISHDSQSIAPGADDNASGVAVLLETARILKGTPIGRTVMFGIFSNEERGRAGSKAYAQQLRNHGVNIKAVINLDILGYNRPAWPFYWDAVQGHATLKHKVKAIIRMVRNYALGIIYGEDVIKVAGREPNRELVAVTARMIREAVGLKVKELVSDDCG